MNVQQGDTTLDLMLAILGQMLEVTLCLISGLQMFDTSMLLVLKIGE